MATPIIQTSGSIAGLGTAGQSRKDFAIGETITFTDTVIANSGEDHVWTLVDAPPLSALVALTGPLTETPTLVPDVTGTWTVVVTVGTLRAKLLFAVVLPFSGMRMPGLDEKVGDYNEAGNARSYHPDFIAGLRSIDALLGAGAADINVKVTAADTTPGNLQAKVAAGSNISLAVLNPGANESLQINATGAAASALATTGADVDISTAAPPTTGEVLKATSATTAAWQADSGIVNHSLGGADHDADTLANLNSKVSDATLIDTADARLSDARTPTSHALGGAEHAADTLANLNSKVSDATLIDTADARLSDARTPTSHSLAGGEHAADTIANLNSKVSDATLAVLDAIQAYTKQQYPTPLVLTDAANIAISSTARNAYTLLATGGVGATREIDNASDALAGMSWTIAFTNDTGARDLTFGANYSWGDETPPVFTAQAAGEITLLTFFVLSPTKVVVTALTGH